MIFEYLIKPSRNTVLRPVALQSTAPQLQLQHVLQMSLCRVSKRVYACVDGVLRSTGLVRVTCLIDPHLDFFYLVPSICNSIYADNFHIACVEMLVDLSHGLEDALEVHCIIFAECLPIAIGLARLHHAASLVLLPQVHGIDDLESLLRMQLTQGVSVSSHAVSPLDRAVILKHLSDWTQVKDQDGNKMYELQQPTPQLSFPIWSYVFGLVREHCLSADIGLRHLGLKILRYLLVSMLVALNPWGSNHSSQKAMNRHLTLLAVASAVMIDALVVEPQITNLFYGQDLPNSSRLFHEEICPCTYLPPTMAKSMQLDSTATAECWAFVQSTKTFLHILLTRDHSRREQRLQTYRNEQAQMVSPRVKKRTLLYIAALEGSTGYANYQSFPTMAFLFFPDIM